MNERMPISRIGGVALDRSVSESERKLRVELAAAFRIAHHLGWNIDTLNHITVRIPDTGTFLMNPLGLGWDEITASALATTAYDGKIISHSGVRLAPAGFNFHGGILKAARTSAA
jgi:ribulose-5-phosphate 4-epimerase/fuculose-1-phosphate aldolase